MISFKLYYEANIANVEIDSPNEDGYSLKGELDSLISAEKRRYGKRNLERGGPIHKWFMTQFVKWATQPGKNYELEDKLGLEPHEYKEGEPEWMKKPDVMNFIGGTEVDGLMSHWPKYSHMIDYFNSLSDREREKIVKKPYEQVEKEVEEWDIKLSKAKIKDRGLKKERDYDIIGKDGDYTWVKLKTKAAYECEGEGMGHCVGGYDPDNPENIIISLWDKRGRPHVTIEMRDYNVEDYDDRPGGVSYDLEEIVQIKGKANEPPADKYKDITARFVKKWLDGAEFNDEAKSIKDLEPSRIVRDDGAGIGMFRHEGGDGAWHWHFEDTKLWDKINEVDVIPVQQDRIQHILKRVEDDPSFGEIVIGDENLSYGFFKEIPKELRNIRGVDGDFIVNNNRLTSLEGSPTDVEGSVFAARNQLETLEGGPVMVDGDFKVDNNNLKNLKGLPKYISGDLHINMNPLESLEGAQDTSVGGTVFVQKYPKDRELFPMAADYEFLEKDNVIAAFKHIGKGLGKGELHPGSWRETPGEVQYVPKYVRAYPEPPHPAPRYHIGNRF